LRGGHHTALILVVRIRILMILSLESHLESRESADPSTPTGAGDVVDKNVLKTGQPGGKPQILKKPILARPTARAVQAQWDGWTTTRSREDNMNRRGSFFHRVVVCGHYVAMVEIHQPLDSTMRNVMIASPSGDRPESLARMTASATTQHVHIHLPP
jgi:hypothetical protein